MPRSTRKKSKTGICHVMQGQESKTCPCDLCIIIPKTERWAPLDVILYSAQHFKESSTRS